MKKNRSTKRALLMSALSMVLCLSMLVGSTFAWFTDSVTSSGNIIKSGTLEVEMYYADGKEDPAAATWKDASEGAIFNYDKWEPGYAEVRHIQIKNVGSLAFKYQVQIVANGEVSKLADVIDVYYVDPAQKVADRSALSQVPALGTLTQALAGMSVTASGELAADTSDTITIALKMKESAGNEYQNLAIGTDFSVVVTAVQLTAEKDSFDIQYDKMATVDDIDELATALDADYDLIRLGADINIPDVATYAAAPTEGVLIPAGKTVTIDLAGYTISQQKGGLTTAYAMINNEGTLTIADSVGTGKISFADTTPYTKDIGWASNTIRNLGVLNVTGGTIENITAAEVMNFSYPHAIDVYQGSVTEISGGTVKSANYDAIRMFCNSTTLATKVVIKGGTIINRISFQNPNNNTHTPGYGILEIKGGNFVTTGNVNANVRLLNFSKDFSNMKATVTGGTFDKGFKTQDHASCGVKTSDWLNINGGTPVSTADELKAALAADGNVVLVADITLDVADTAFTVAKGVSTKLDLNGHNITATGTSEESVQLFSVNGNLEIVGNGTISLKGNNFPWNTSYRYTAINIRETGVVTLGNGVKVVCEAGTEDGYGMSYAVDIYTTGTLNVNGASLHSNYIAVRCFYGDSIVNVNSGSITSSKNNYGIWPQSAPGATITVADGINYTINPDNGIYSFS